MTFEAIVSGLHLEGLCTDADSVWVSDPVKGGVRRCRTDGAVQAFLPEKKWVGSLLRAQDDVVLVSGDSGIIWLDGETGLSGELVSTVNGAPLPGVNEMAADRHGTIYFGGIDIAALAATMTSGKPLPFGSVSLYSLDAAGRAAQLVSGLHFSNGIAVSSDGKRLYHNETFVGTSAYDILPDGRLGATQRLLDKHDCDGLALDEDGTLWIAGYETNAIVRMRPDGTLLEPFPIPGGGASNVRFGGDDGRDLYITSIPEGAAAKQAAGMALTKEDSVLYRGRSDRAGLEVHRAAFRLTTAHRSSDGR